MALRRCTWVVAVLIGVVLVPAIVGDHGTILRRGP